MPLRRRTRDGALVIYEGGVPSPPSFSGLVKLKTEQALLPVKKEHEAMAADETTLKWARAEYAREQLER